MKPKLILTAVIVAIVGIWAYSKYSDYQEKKAILESYLQQRNVRTDYGTSSRPASGRKDNRQASGRKVSCPACGATGYASGYQCPGCNGTGLVDEATALQINEMLGEMESAGYISPSSSNGGSNSYSSNSRNECVACNPSGDCSHCKGIGIVYYDGEYNTEGGYMDCPVCKGYKRCTTCGGKHYL